MTDYTSRESAACVGTFDILEGGAFMDQFNESVTGLADARDLKLREWS